MIPFRETQSHQPRISTPLSVDRSFLQDILGESTKPRSNEFRATKFPMPDGRCHDLVFHSFVICGPEAIDLSQVPGKVSKEAFKPVTQWLARVREPTGGDEVVSLRVANGAVTGQASFRGHTYGAVWEPGDAPNAMRYQLRGEAMSDAGILKTKPALRGPRRFFHRQPLIADLALLVDSSLTFDFLGRLPDLQEAMIAMVAELNAVYFRDVEVVFRLTYFGFMNVAPSPYQTLTRVNGVEVPATVLEAFVNDWNMNRTDVRRDLAVLVTKHLAISGRTGVAEGLAEVNTLCNKEKAYVVFRFSPDPDKLAYRAAHEIGHCFGAIHTHCTPDPDSPIGFVDGCVVATSQPGDPPPPCFAGDRFGNPHVPNVPGTIMSQCRDITLRFHELSAAQIEDALVSKTCLEPASFKLLSNEADEQNLSSQFGTTLYFAIDVPEHVVEFRIATTGGTGDVDLYAQRRALAVYASWVSASPGNAEQLVFQRPVRPGRWYIRLEPAPSTGGFANVRLTAAYQDAVLVQNNVPHVEPSLSTGEVLFFKLNVPSSQPVTLTATHASGQFEFFVRWRERPTLVAGSVDNAYSDTDPSSPTKTYSSMAGHPAGVWYVGIRARANLQDLVVTISY